jgi:hypothetical protein
LRLCWREALGGTKVADISVGDAVAEGFVLIGRTPLSVLAWGFVRTAFGVAVLAMLAPFFLQMFSVFAQAATQPGAGPPSFMTMPGYWQFQGLAQLVNLAQVFLSAILVCAVFRAVLHPERSSFAYMRVGAPELYLFVLTLGAIFAFVIGLLVLIIPIAIVAGILVLSHAGVALAILIPLAVLAGLLLLVYVALRFSLVGPMMVDDDQFHFIESWTLTRGRVGSLFLIALALLGILIAAEAVVGGLILAIGAGTLGAAAGGFQHLPEFFRQSPAMIVSKLAPLLAVIGLLAIPLTGCFLAIVGAPWARAYRDLKGSPAVATTFS